MDDLVRAGLSVDWAVDIPEPRLKELIGRVSFYNTKAKNIKRTAAII
jgi:endonuclease III